MILATDTFSQLRFLHRLRHISPKISDTCKKCQLEGGSLIHMVWSPIVQSYWWWVVSWPAAILGTFLVLDPLIRRLGIHNDLAVLISPLYYLLSRILSWMGNSPWLDTPFIRSYEEWHQTILKMLQLSKKKSLCGQTHRVEQRAWVISSLSPPKVTVNSIVTSLKFILWMRIFNECEWHLNHNKLVLEGFYTI